MDSVMVGERDIVGISVPFAAGVAAGAFLCARVEVRSALPADILLLIIISIIALTVRFDRPGDRNDRRQRILLGTAFLIAGTFCFMNQRLASGVPEYSVNPLAEVAAMAAARLKSSIDSIPYPTQTTGALIKALLTGDKSDLSQEIIGIFRDSGAAHILALSGLHLGTLYLILTKALAVLGNSQTSRRLRSSLILASALFYSIMTGASPSIIRAFLFITINETCKTFGRKRDPVRILLAALTIQLAVTPDVITSVGFQLSYMAMAGIFLLYPALERIYPQADGSAWSKLNPLRKIWNAAMLSISCQVFTGPLAWHYFHSFPKYFILTNLIALPLTSAIMTLSVATVALSCLGLCPEPLVILNDHAMQALVFCLKVISGLDEP